MEQQKSAAVIEGRPHGMEFFRPPGLLGCLCVVCMTAALCLEGVSDAWRLIVTGTVAAVSVVLWLTLAFRRRAVCHWRWENGVFFFIHGALARKETAFRTDRLLLAETKRSLWGFLWGGVRVKLYAEAADRAAFSAVLPRKQADALIERLMVAEKRGERWQQKRIASGPYAALPSAMADGVMLMLLGSAAVFSIAGAGLFFMNITAVVLWLGALVRMVWRLLDEGRLSVNRSDSGWIIVKGIGGSRRLYIPDRAVTGIRESSTLPALLCGARRVELLCGGRRIVCMRWYVPNHLSESPEAFFSYPACDLLGCDGNAFVMLKNSHGVRKRYFHIAIAVLCGAVLTGFAELSLMRSGGVIGAITAALCVCVGAGIFLQCAAGVGLGRTFGITVSSSSVRAAGMGLLTAESLTLRRGCLAEVRVGRTPIDRVHGLCTVELIPKGCRCGVKCRCMPYDRAQALMERVG